MQVTAADIQLGHETSYDSSDGKRSSDDASKRSEQVTRWVEEYADMLFRRALLRVGNVEDAKDVVQETLIAAVRGNPKTEELRSEKAWLLGIMKHKVLDLLRRRYRQPVSADSDDLQRLEESQFDGGGDVAHWLPRMAPRQWERAEAKLESGEFAGILNKCLSRLPERHARAFVLRELDGFTTDRLCAEFNLASGHLFVLLHRARLALRRCLELSGLRPGKSTS